MSSEGPTLDDLIRTQREGARLSDEQRARNRARVLSRALLGTAVVAPLGIGASKASTLGWVTKALAAALLAGGAAAVYVGLAPHGSNAPAVAPSAALPVFSAPVASATMPAAPSAVPAAAAAASSASSASVSKRRQPPAASSSPSLAAEVQLMHDVQGALRSGQPARALALLDASDANRDHGAMAEERAAARVVTLCQLGRVDAARAEAARFLRERPRSPLAARVRASCAKAQ